MTADELLGLLRDTAQGASNSAASTVSAPVDVLAWLLRKGGLPVGPAPVLGSDWMAQKGLTAQPKNALAGMAGETIGNILPIAASAKAPQIANALMRADEALTNQLGPTIANAAEQYMVKTGMMQPATVWHGSPHAFDAFDASKIGTGEGAQAYGHGLYLAESQKTAQWYAESLAGKQYSPSDLVSANGMTLKELMKDAPPLARAKVTSYVNNAQGDMAKASADFDAFVQQQHRDNGALTDAGKAALAAAQGWMRKLADAKISFAPKPTGNLYKVDLPDSVIAKMLDWDKPLSQQPEVLKALETHPTMGKESLGWRGAPPGMWERAMSSPSRTGEWLYRELGDSGVEQTAAARQAGIPGIRYLDGGSRGAGAGTSNYVVFPGNENLLRILERNGVPIGN